MPTYDYECPRCSEKFDRLVAWHAKDQIDCPRCGSRAKRQLSFPHFRMAYEEPHGFYDSGTKSPPASIRR